MAVDYARADARFVDAVRTNLDGVDCVSIGSCRGCDECGIPEDATDDDVECYDEPSFRSGGCDSCGSSFAGDSFHAHGFIPNDEPGSIGDIVHLDVCSDCAMFHANGETPGNSFETWTAGPYDDTSYDDDSAT